MSRIISREEVKKHQRCDSTWIIIANKVYDVTPFLEEHPGGADTLLDVAGKDGTRQFEEVGHSDDARTLMTKYYIGDLPASEATESYTRRSPARAGGSRGAGRGRSTSRSPSGSSQRSVKPHSCVKAEPASPRRPGTPGTTQGPTSPRRQPCVPASPRGVSERPSAADTPCPPSLWWVKYAIGGVLIAVVAGVVYRQLSSGPSEPLTEPSTK